jgi:EamA-like transporter family
LTSPHDPIISNRWRSPQANFNTHCERHRATNLLLVTFLLPISALLLGVLALGETITVRALVGMLLIGAGLASIDGRIWCSS